ncbi:MAG: lysophospholipid acyltransferase family protein [candidate division WOR-3 bacterium]
MLRRNRYSFRWKFAHCVLKFLFKVLTGGKVVGKEKLKIPDKPVIIVANHSSYMDPPLIIAFWEREIYFLGHEGLFKNSIFGGFLKFFNGLPLPSGFKKSYELLDVGYDIGIFPEGGRNKLPNVKIGAFKLSKDKNVPVIIFGIYGNRGRVFKKVLRWVFKRGLYLVYLKTLYPENFSDAEEMAKEFRKTVMEFIEKYQ